MAFVVKAERNLDMRAASTSEVIKITINKKVTWSWQLHWTYLVLNQLINSTILVKRLKT